MRRIAVGLPACNEAERIVACVGALLDQAGRAPDKIVVVANNCTDETSARLRQAFGCHPSLDLRELSLPKPFNHVGWARRLAMDGAADYLDDPFDVLMTTDGDTTVAPNWVEANLRHLEHGCDVVAGSAHLMRQERMLLSPQHRHRLLIAGKYLTALAYLRAENAPPHDLWPRHDYEGGASIALRLGVYRKVGGSPILSTGEDRALFDAARSSGARVRHATDVRVFTSCRLVGRASGGTADTLGLWESLADHMPAHGLPRLDDALSGALDGEALCFDVLEQELARAQAMIRRSRESRAFDLRAATPEVQPVIVGALRELEFEGLAC
jgi:GT2 family glycosyltransferase